MLRINKFNLHKILIDWAPYVLLVFFYENVHFISDIFKIPSRDGWLIAADKFLFGGQLPNLLLQKIEHPLLSEWFSLVYLFYLPLVVVAPLHFYFKHQTLFKKITTLICLTAAIGWLGYIFVPALGPAVSLRTEFVQPLAGYKITQIQFWLIDLARAPRDTFPSLHVALSAVILFFCWRQDRKVFWWLLPFILSIWLAAVYLRYHYLVDISGGIVVALAAYFIYLRFINKKQFNNIIPKVTK